MLDQQWVTWQYLLNVFTDYNYSKLVTLCDKVCQWLAEGWWFPPGPPVSSTNKTDCQDITEILFKVALNTINQKKTKQTNLVLFQEYVWQK